MRQYKFRGKQVDNGEWVYGNLIRSSDSTKGFSCIIIPQENSDMWHAPRNDVIGFDKWYQVDPKTVGQYTGLKDKNGVEIWEGDILNPTNHKRYCWVVSFKCGCFVGEQSNYRAYYQTLHELMKMNDLEIIGNIHENPELLKELMGNE